MLLTARQKRFVDEYLLDLNATQAAVRAGYSARTAGAIGCENLTKPEVAAAICSAQTERANRTKVTADDIVKELWWIATTSSSDRTRVAALSWLGKHLAMFTQKVQVSEDLPTIRFVLTDESTGIPTASPSGNGFG
ncbi:terminase small subunit [Gemmatimonadota bacterium]